MPRIDYQGRTYQYDEDFDSWYRVYEQPPVSLRERVICGVLFAVMCAFTIWTLIK